MAERPRRERGVALLVAMLATALLTVTVLEFTYSSQVGYRRAAHWHESERAGLAAESGLALAAEVLSFDGQIAELLSGAKIPPETAALLGGLDPRLAKIDGALDMWAKCSEPGPWSCNTKIGLECTLPLSMADTIDSSPAEASADEAGFFTVRIDDETGLYNLNRLATAVPNEIERASRLLRLVGVNPTLVGPIADWVDADSTPFSYPPGAEASQYAAEKRRAVPRNKPMATFRELALVMGVGPRELRALRPVATALPQQFGTINVNTAPLPVLQALSPQFDDESLLATLHAQRCAQPFVDADDLQTRVPGIETTGVVPLLGYASSWFRVRSTARVGDTVKSVEALLVRQGARVDPYYFVTNRSANIADVDSPPATGFEVPAPLAGGQS